MVSTTPVSVCEAGRDRQRLGALGSEVAEAIDWRSPRMVCIAAGFSQYDRVAVHRLPERVDLVRYRVFEGGLLSLLLVGSAPESSSVAPIRRQRREREMGAVVGVGEGKSSVQATEGRAPACLRDLYCELDEALTEWGEVEVNVLRHYIAYRLMVNRASVIFRPKHEVILMYLALGRAGPAMGRRGCRPRGGSRGPSTAPRARRSCRTSCRRRSGCTLLR